MDDRHTVCKDGGYEEANARDTNFPEPSRERIEQNDLSDRANDASTHNDDRDVTRCEPEFMIDEQTERRFECDESDRRH